MKRILCDDRRGFTTAELLVAALFGMIVMATLYGFYREQLFQLLAQETKTATLEDARGALDMMVRDLRNAGSWGSGTQPGLCLRVYSASSTSIRIQADLDGNGDCSSATGEDVTYDLSSAIKLNAPSTSASVVRSRISISNSKLPVRASRWMSAIRATVCSATDVATGAKNFVDVAAGIVMR